MLLISSSFVPGKEYLDHCIQGISTILNGISEILFVPFALKDHDEYETIVKQRFNEIGIAVKSLHHYDNYNEIIRKSKAFFLGGGNTFRLLLALQKSGIIEVLKKRIEEGGVYIGSSAGANVAGINIKTTNDMPIVYPESFEGLGLVPFNINPHYVYSSHTQSMSMETRDQRIQQFHEENDQPVVALEEGVFVSVEGGEVVLKGNGIAKVFFRGKDPTEIKAPSKLPFRVE